MPPKTKAKAGKQDAKGGKQEKAKSTEDSKKLKAANAGTNRFEFSLMEKSRYGIFYARNTRKVPCSFP